ncbi:beta-lactamase hydrolase domain-containing protein [Celeribacter sp.]|uniref:beta-lactamase hydrolase domain-containing protein n=1 Tax=Celeribacter sp. TaxID=1890673 RepID=UPI003A94E7B1
MKIKRINGMFTIATQLELSKIARLAERGYKTIICNRPDGESMDQPQFSEIEAEAQRVGMRVCYIPIKRSGPTPTNHADFAKAIDTLPHPTVAYCSSGARAALMWTLFDQSRNGGNAHGAERRVGAVRAGALAPNLPPQSVPAFSKATQLPTVLAGEADIPKAGTQVLKIG